MIGKAVSSSWTMTSVRQAPSLIERRQAHRIHLVCRFAKVAGRGDTGLWRICNMSDRGMMMRSPCRATPGDLLSISLSENFTVQATVIWSDSDHVGVGFLEPLDSAALLCALATEQRSPRYRPLRLAVDGRALAFDDSGVHSVKVRNISRHGVGLEHRNRLRPGNMIKLVFENGFERRGVVRWAGQEQAGLFLLEPFSAEEMASVRRF
jgi:hypothetical protein